MLQERPDPVGVLFLFFVAFWLDIEDRENYWKVEARAKLFKNSFRVQGIVVPFPVRFGGAFLSLPVHPSHEPCT